MRKIPDDLVVPDYEKSIIGVPNWILKNFEIEEIHKPLDLPTGFEKIVLVIIDALGYRNFEMLDIKKDFPEPIIVTSTFPSTTTTALTSIFTGSLPAEHGMLGFILFLKEYGFLTNMIELSPFGYGRDLLKDRMDFSLPVKTVFQMLSERGLSSASLIPSVYTKSGLSRMLHFGSQIVGYTSIGDMLVKLTDLSKGDFSLITAYVPYVDKTGHVENEESYLEEASVVLMALNRRIREISRSAAVLITADHGMIRTPKEKEIWWSPEDEVMEYLEMPPAGERRMMHLYSRDPDSLIGYLEERYGDFGVFLKKEESSELFGGYHRRVGDVILIALEDFSFNFRYRREEISLSGMHGGLSDFEMLVPVIFFGR